MSADLDTMTAAELRRRIISKDVSPVELTLRAQARAEATQAILNAFFVLLPESALAAARAAEDAVMRGQPLGLLRGLPFSAKDLMAVAGVPYASGSRTMAKNVATADAPAVERARAAGAILIGKTTTSEFGCKPVGDSPLTGITRHPWNLAKTPGGSSAGAAASVAAGITPFALGTDGGGSVRIPCCFTGLAGIKGFGTGLSGSYGHLTEKFHSSESMMEFPSRLLFVPPPLPGCGCCGEAPCARDPIFFG